ncbi:MAG: hypothetical protein HQK76_20520 [Desulfobacterales bacterium]|nr:hypothetical protein [Desulfobacterales bacterium]
MKRLKINVSIIVLIICTFLYSSEIFSKNLHEFFMDIEIEEPFKPYLLNNRTLMEMGGVKILKLDDGRKVILCVTMTEYNDDSAKDKIRRIKVCRNKAVANLLTEKEGVQVATYSKTSEQSVIVTENGVEKGKSIAESLEITEAKAKGIVQSLPIIGKWRSKDGGTFFLAIGDFIE